MFYQTDSPALSYHLSIIYTGDMQFPEHIHTAMELFYVKKGTLQCSINQKEYTLQAGQAFLALPFEPHAYLGSRDLEGVMVIFSTDYVPVFISEIQSLELCSSRFVPSLPLLDFPNKQESKIAMIGRLYLLCDDAVKQNGLKPCERENHVLVRKILEYIDDNFTEEISLHTMAKALNYTPSYLSTIITRSLKRSFTNLLNDCRLNHATILLHTTDQSIAEISELCGFGSIRTFNRVFKESFGRSPKDFRQYHHIQQIT